MEKIISFICEHYETIILVVACLLDVVLFLFGVLRKKKDLTFDECLNCLPLLIASAEKVYPNGNGEAKLKIVLDAFKKLYFKSTGIELSDDSNLMRIVLGHIERILFTPQKKGK